MTQGVTEVSPECSLDVVLTRMHEESISCVVVCEDGVPRGLITERDVPAIASELLQRRGGERSAADVMSSSVRAVDINSTIADATAMAQRYKIRHLPVLSPTGDLAGLVTQSDLFRAYAHQMEHLVAERTQELESANRALELLSKQDALLEIGNRRAMDEMLTYLHGLAKRYGRPYSVVLCDVDYFKRFNDTHGHLAGDEALRSVVRQVERAARSVDLLFRYGGEEILVALPETSAAQARAAAERIRAGVEHLALPHSGSPLGMVTLSCGVAGVDGPEASDTEWDAVVSDADRELYKAKEAGRNRVGASSD